MTDRSTKIVYQNVLILARKAQFYIIKAPIAIAEEIAHLQAIGTATMSMALRPDLDQRPVDATALGETTNRIIQKYGLPIPRDVSARQRPAGDAPADPVRHALSLGAAQRGSVGRRGGPLGAPRPRQLPVDKRYEWASRTPLSGSAGPPRVAMPDDPPRGCAGAMTREHALR